MIASYLGHDLVLHIADRQTMAMGPSFPCLQNPQKHRLAWPSTLENTQPLASLSYMLPVQVLRRGHSPAAVSLHCMRASMVVVFKHLMVWSLVYGALTLIQVE